MIINLSITSNRVVVFDKAYKGYRALDSMFWIKKKQKEEKESISPTFFRSEAKKCAENKDLIGEILDYTPESLKKIDSTIDTVWTKDRFKGAEFGKTDNITNLSYTGLVLNFGSYFGEVLIKKFKGEWKKSEKLGWWVVNIDGNEVNVFHIAEDCFREPSKYYFTCNLLEKELRKR